MGLRTKPLKIIIKAKNHPQFHLPSHLSPQPITADLILPLKAKITLELRLENAHICSKDEKVEPLPITDPITTRVSQHPQDKHRKRNQTVQKLTQINFYPNTITQPTCPTHPLVTQHLSSPAQLIALISQEVLYTNV